MTNCPRTNCKNEAIVDKTYGVLPCFDCQKRDSLSAPVKIGPEFVNISKSNRIQHERDVGAKDLLQPFSGGKPNKEFAQAYPKLIKDYYSKEEIRKL